MGMHKTTVYLSDREIELLKKSATLRNVSVAEAIRSAIQDSCRPKSKDEEILWETLDRVWAKTSSLNASRIEKTVDRAVKEVRHGKKAARRS